MNQKWKKFLYSSAVIALSGTMAFSYIEPVYTVFAEEPSGATETANPDDSDNAVTTPAASTEAPEETATPDAKQPQVTPAATEAPVTSEEPEKTAEPAASAAAKLSQTPDPTTRPDFWRYDLTIQNIDTDDAYFNADDMNNTWLHIRPGKELTIQPLLYAVYQDGSKTLINDNDTDVSISKADADQNPDNIISDEKPLTIVTPKTTGFAYYYLDLTDKKTGAYSTLNVEVGPHYNIENVTPNTVYMGPQETKKNAIKVTAYDNFKYEEKVVNDYTVSKEGEVKVDPATGNVTSYEEYGSFSPVISYKDSTNNPSFTVNVISKVLDLSFSKDEVSVNENADRVWFTALNSLSVFPNQAYNSPLTFKSSNENVAKVEKNDNESSDFSDWCLIPQKAGDVTITATAESGVSASFVVHVTKSGKAVRMLYNAKDTYYPGEKDLYLNSGDTKDLDLVLFDKDGNDVTDTAFNEIKWDEASYMDSVKIKRDGKKITVTGNGNKRITASIGQGSQQSLTWNVHVIDKDPENIEFTQKSYKFHIGDDSQYVYFNVKPDTINAEDIGNLKFTSSDEKVVGVYNSDSTRYIYPNGAGTATITVETPNGKKATAEVTVEDGDFARYIDSDTQGKTINLKPGDSLNIKPIYTLKNLETTDVLPKDEKVTYSVSPDDVKNDVILTEHSDGTATLKVLNHFDYAYVTARLSNGSFTSWNLQSKTDITNLSFKNSEYTATDESPYIYLENQLNVTPESSRGTALKWTTSDIRSAAVSSGTVSLLDYDKDVTITASTQDGKIKASTIVHLRKAGAPTTITLNGNPNSDSVKTYVDYSVPFNVGFEPEYSSSKANVSVSDPNGSTDLDDNFKYFKNGNILYVYSVSGKKVGNASITVTSAKNSSVKKTFNIQVVTGKPSKKELGLKYDLSSLSDDGGEVSENPKTYTFLKGETYDLKVNSNLSPSKDSVAELDKNDDHLKLIGTDYYVENDVFTHEYIYKAEKAGNGTIKLIDGSTIQYNVVDVIVNQSVKDTSKIKDDKLKKAVENASDQSTGMDKALKNAAENVNMAGNEKIVKAAENLSTGQTLKVEITNEIKYNEVSDQKISVTITPKYVVKVVDNKGNQVGKPVDEGEAKVTEPVELKLPVGTQNQGKTLYVKHIKNDSKHTSRIYLGTVDKDGNLEFINPDGFSTFEITPENPAKVTTQTTSYMSLQDAIDAVKDQGEFTVNNNYKKEDGIDITVNKEIKFTLKNNSGLKFNIKAGEGYKMSKDGDNTYIFTKDESYVAPKVKIGNQRYNSLQDAVNAVANGATITVTDAYTSATGTNATVNREVSFKLDNQSKVKFTINAGNGYELKQSGNTYTVTKKKEPTKEKTVTMYRAYNPNSGEHFYTANKKEFDHIVSLGWHNEGVGWIAPENSKTPVYRLYNKNGGEHHYTTSAVEKNNLLKAGWSDEGIGWYSDDSKRTPLYRQYNPNAFANNHNYSTSKSENDHLVSLGWRAEGIGWYGVRAK